MSNVNDEIEFSLFTPFTMSINGPTFCGKTEFVLDLIARRHEITKDRLEKVFYVFAEMQDRFKEFAQAHKDVLFTDDLQNLNKIVEENSLVVFDDFLLSFETSKNNFITELFIKGCHHRKISVIIILQVFKMFYSRVFLFISV